MSVSALQSCNVCHPVTNCTQKETDISKQPQQTGQDFYNEYTIPASSQRGVLRFFTIQFLYIGYSKIDIKIFEPLRKIIYVFLQDWYYICFNVQKITNYTIFDVPYNQHSLYLMFQTTKFPYNNYLLLLGEASCWRSTVYYNSHLSKTPKWSNI